MKLKPYEEKEAGQLFDSLNGNGIPLIVFLNHEGVEVERILGFRSPEEYLQQITDIYSREGTFLNLKERFISGDFSSDVLSKLSEKCKSNPDQELCELVYNQVVLNQETLPQSTTFGANLFFARKDLDSGSPESMEALIQSISDISLVSEAYIYLIQYYQMTGDTQKESLVYRKYSDNMTSDPSALNRYAWRMTELQINLKDALSKSNTAIELSYDNPPLQSYILDTKAEILWLLDRTDEALRVIDIAISIDPTSTYFLEQKEKFLNSRVDKREYGKIK